ncbi:MAG: HAD family hydrolase [Lachnospiraceae bacterium]|jgi:HAD superfamily hydrolase (TIGR01509 family)
MNYKAILFDMDGTLLDSEVLMRNSGVRALADFGIECTADDFLPFTGQGELRFLGGVAAKYGHEFDPEMKERCYYYFGEYVEEEAVIPERLMETLDNLKEKGVRIAVCTSADRTKVRHNLRALGVSADYFETIITGDDIKNAKPDPEVYLKGAAALGLSPEDCLVVEDAPSGIASAHAAGMKAAAITSSFDEETLRANSDPDMIIDKMPELLDIVFGE